jgi:hypothetical protein
MKRIVALALTISAGWVPPAHAWTWPVDGPVLRPFVFGSDPYAGGQHRGIDVGGAKGADVRAPAAGVVSFAGSVPTGGKTVTLRTSDGYAVTLVHLGSIVVSRGAGVDEGATVGTIGLSGEPEHAEPYVHLGVRVADEEEGYVDPLSLLPPREQRVSATSVSDSPLPVQAVVSASASAPSAAPAAVEAATSSQAEPDTPVASSSVRTVEAKRVEAGPDAYEPAPAAVPAQPVADVAATTAVRPAPHALRVAPADVGLTAAPTSRSLRQRSNRSVLHGIDRPQPAPDTRSVGSQRERQPPLDVRSLQEAPWAEPSPGALSERGRAQAKATSSDHRSIGDGFATAWLALLALMPLTATFAVFVRRRAAATGGEETVRIMRADEQVGAAAGANSGCRRVAVRGGSEAHRPRRRVRRPLRHLRALPPPEGQRRPDGERHGRARDAGDGRSRQRERIAA